MVKNNSPKRALSQYTAADVRALRERLKRERGWTLARFSKELGNVTEGYTKMLIRGERPITPRIASALQRLERDEIYFQKEVEDTDAQTLEWLVRGIELRADKLTDKVRHRLRKLL